MIKVIISQRVDFIESRNELRDQLSHDLIEMLSSLNILGYPIPNVLSEFSGLKGPLLDNWISQINPNGIILSGGNDVDEFEVRDKMEHLLLDYAKLNRIPVLGICKGMLSMGVYGGANIIKVDGHVRQNHRISGDIKKIVNSYHNFALENCPEFYQVMAFSEDGSIEAIKHESLPWQGWMWHPERYTEFCEDDVQRIRNLFAK